MNKEFTVSVFTNTGLIEFTVWAENLWGACTAGRNLFNREHREIPWENVKAFGVIEGKRKGNNGK